LQACRRTPPSGDQTERAGCCCCLADRFAVAGGFCVQAATYFARMERAISPAWTGRHRAKATRARCHFSVSLCARGAFSAICSAALACLPGAERPLYSGDRKQTDKHRRGTRTERVRWTRRRLYRRHCHVALSTPIYPAGPAFLSRVHSPGDRDGARCRTPALCCRRH